MQNMLRVGLIGTPLGHSQSADYFAQHHPDCHYQTYDKSSLYGLRQWVDDEQLDGFNVTSPYKTAILEYLDKIDTTVQQIGAVNCVRVRRQNGILTLEGYNTDAPAFAETLQPLLQDWHRQALVLGTGGAACAVGYALRKLGIATTFVSRHPELHSDTIDYNQLSGQLNRYHILVNATPVGMWPHNEESPMLDIQGIDEQHLCYDLIYNPIKSKWLHQVEKQGATICNGLAMLHRQADMSYALWTRQRLILPVLTLKDYGRL